MTGPPPILPMLLTRQQVAGLVAGGLIPTNPAAAAQNYERKFTTLSQAPHVTPGNVEGDGFDQALSTVIECAL
jgi:hypothetical protein